MNPTLRILVVGHGFAGKSLLVRSLCHGDAAERRESVPRTVGCGVDVSAHRAAGRTFDVEWLEVGAMEQHHTARSVYYRQFDGVVVVFDAGSERSFAAAATWLADVADVVAERELRRRAAGGGSGGGSGPGWLARGAPEDEATVGTEGAARRREPPAWASQAHVGGGLTTPSAAGGPDGGGGSGGGSLLSPVDGSHGPLQPEDERTHGQLMAAALRAMPVLLVANKMDTAPHPHPVVPPPRGGGGGGGYHAQRGGSGGGGGYYPQPPPPPTTQLLPPPLSSLVEAATGAIARMASAIGGGAAAAPAAASAGPGRPPPVSRYQAAVAKGASRCKLDVPLEAADGGEATVTVCGWTCRRPRRHTVTVDVPLAQAVAADDVVPRDVVDAFLDDVAASVVGGERGGWGGGSGGGPRQPPPAHQQQPHLDTARATGVLAAGSAGAPSFSAAGGAGAPSAAYQRQYHAAAAPPPGGGGGGGHVAGGFAERMAALSAGGAPPQPHGLPPPLRGGYRS
jgi:hypothetical protein